MLSASLAAAPKKPARPPALKLSDIEKKLEGLSGEERKKAAKKFSGRFVNWEGWVKDVVAKGKNDFVHLSLAPLPRGAWKISFKRRGRDKDSLVEKMHISVSGRIERIYFEKIGRSSRERIRVVLKKVSWRKVPGKRKAKEAAPEKDE